MSEKDIQTPQMSENGKVNNNENLIKKIKDICVNTSSSLFNKFRNNNDDNSIYDQNDLIELPKSSYQAMSQLIKDCPSIPVVLNGIKGTLTQCDIPVKNLIGSTQMDGWKRGFSIGENGITKQANLKGLCGAATLSGVMNIASMLVGQYYMAQINNQLKSIDDKLNTIINFQKNEYDGKIDTIIQDIKGIMDNHDDILANENLKKDYKNKLNIITKDKLNDLFNQAIRAIRCNIDSVNKWTEYEKNMKNINYWKNKIEVLLQSIAVVEMLNLEFNDFNIPEKIIGYNFVKKLEEFENIIKKIEDWHDTNKNDFQIDFEQNYYYNKNGFWPHDITKDNLDNINYLTNIKENLPNLRNLNLLEQKIPIVKRGNKYYILNKIE